MNRLIFKMPLLFSLTAILLFHPAFVRSNPSEDPSGISARRAADFVHSVIEAGRTTSSQAVVDRLGKSDSLKTTEHWKQENTLPLPAQFLMMSSRMSNQRGIGMRYRLMSLWPINPKNAPPSQTEKRGLEQVAQNPTNLLPGSSRKTVSGFTRPSTLIKPWWNPASRATTITRKALKQISKLATSWAES